MGNLPPEVWYYILQFLPPTILRHLYPVNSVCFDIAMDARYCDVAFDRIDKQLLQNLDILQNPDVARRVKSLRIATHLFKEESGTQNTAPSNLFSRMIHGLKRANQKPVEEDTASSYGSSIHMTRALIDILQHLNNIHTFYLDWTSFDDDNFPTISLWSGIARNLQNLTIAVGSRKLKIVLPLPTVEFPLLQRLQIIIKIRKYEDAAKVAASLLATASFMNSLKDTLQHFSIQYSPHGGLSLLYKHLGTFPCLYSLDIDLSLSLSQLGGGGVTAYSASIIFLERHVHIIRNLTLSGTGGNQPILYYTQLRLPNLRHVSINASLMAACWPTMQTFLKAHSTILESLKITDPISTAEIDQLLDVFHHKSGSNCALSKLSISTYRLDLALLLKLADRLERLQVLKLRIAKVAHFHSFPITPGQFFPRHLPPDKDADEFVSEIAASQELKAWNLRNITILRRSCCGELVLWRLMQFFAMCIPTISSFADNSDMEIPEPPNLRPNPRGSRCTGGGFECVYGKDGLDGKLC